MEIQPHRGIDDILLGTRQDEIERVLGPPDRRSRGFFDDDVESEIWYFRLMRVELAFDSDVEYRLARITTSHPHATVVGFNPIGLSEALLLERYPYLYLQLDCGADGKDFIDRLQDISYWVADDHVQTITVYPYYDIVRERPEWPA